MSFDDEREPPRECEPYCPHGRAQVEHTFAECFAVIGGECPNAAKARERRKADLEADLASLDEPGRANEL